MNNLWSRYKLKLINKSVGLPGCETSLFVNIGEKNNWEQDEFSNIAFKTGEILLFNSLFK